MRVSQPVNQNDLQKVRSLLIPVTQYPQPDLKNIPAGSDERGGIHAWACFALGNSPEIIPVYCCYCTRLAEPLTVHFCRRRAGGVVRGKRLGSQRRAATRGVAAYFRKLADALPSHRMPSPWLDGPLLSRVGSEAGARSGPSGHTRCVPAPNQLSWI